MRKRNRWWMPVAAALLLGAAGARAQSVFGSEPVGTASGEQSVTVTAQAAGTITTVEVVTAGASGLDFAAGGGASSCASGLLLAAVGSTCTEFVTFTPAAVGLRTGAVVLLDSGGNVLATAYLSGTGSGGLGVLVPGNILPVAGDGNYLGSVQDGKPATEAELNHPSSVALDGAGNMYIADRYNYRIRKVTAPATGSIGTGIISTIAGDGNPTYTGDNGPAVNATINTPWGLALDGAGNLFIADTGNNAIRKITAATGIITTVAGNGTAGYAGDGTAATSAELNQPQGVTVDEGGNIYIADTLNHRIRRVDAGTGIITTVAGDGFMNGDGSGGYNGDNIPATSAELNYPYTVAFDAGGNLYIPDSGNNRVRMVNTAGTITTFAGTGTLGYSGDGSAATQAELWAPSGAIADAAGNVYISDTQNASIRKVSSATGFISTIARQGEGEFLYNGSFSAVSIYGPVGLFLDGSGNLYLADSLNMRIREIQSNFVGLDYTLTAVRQGDQSAPKSETVENDGNDALDLTAITPDANAALDAPTTTCTTGSPFLGVDQDCTIGAVFAPSPLISPTDPETGNIDLAGATVNSPLDIQLIGDATAVNSTTTTVTSNSTNDQSDFGQSVTFTATVNTGSGTGNLTGTVSFFDGATTLAANVDLSAPGITATASYTTPALTVGSHSITAQYIVTDPGHLDLLHFGSTSAVLTQTVSEVTATSLGSSLNPAQTGQTVLLTATVAIAGGGGVNLDGTVAFTSGGTTLCNASTLGQAGTAYQATCSTAALPQGLDAVTATYSGDATKFILTSAGTLLQDVQGPSTTTVASSLTPTIYGNPVTFTATVTPSGGAAATGTVNFLDGGTQIGSATLANGTAALTTSALGVGSHTITAAYQGDTNNTPSTSSAITQVVNQAVTATALTATPNPAVAGALVTIKAAVTVTQGVSAPTGKVTFTDSFNGGAAAALACAPQPTAPTATCTTTALAAGTHSIVATYAGDTNDVGSVSAPATLTVVQETIALASSPNPSVYGTPVVFTVTVPSVGATPATKTVNILEAGQTTPIGTITLSGNPGSGTLTISSLAVSTGATPDSITASYVGDSNYVPIVSSAVVQIVNQAQTATSLSAAPNPGIAGAPVAIKATVTQTVGMATQTGTVSFVDTFNGTATALGRVPLSAGTAAIDPLLAPGNHSIAASYGGDTNNSGSASTLALTVVQATTAATVASSENPAQVLSAVTFTAKVTGNGGIPTGSVNFLAAGASFGSANLDATGTATLMYAGLAAGTYSVTANYAGDANDLPSTSAALSQVVTVIPTVTGLGVSTTNGTSPQLILVASVLGSSGPTPTGTVTFNSGATVIGAATLDSTGVGALSPDLAPGVYNIVATYGGDAVHGPSSSSPASVSTVPVGYGITVTPSSVTLATTQNATVTVALNSNSGFADTIGLGCASLPAAVTCHFSAISAALTAGATDDVQLTIDTNLPLTGGTSAMNAKGGNGGISLAGLLFPVGLFCGWLLWRIGRHNAARLNAGLLLLLSSAALLLSGCGGFTQVSAAPGTYVIQVTGVGANSNISHYQNITLKITP